MFNKNPSALPAHLPPIWTPLYIHRNSLYFFLKKEIPQIMRECSKLRHKDKISVLDVGCGTMPYLHLFIENENCECYEGADIEKIRGVSVLVDPVTQTIQADDESYDLVVHFQALEHVSNPKKFINECWRVLRPNGVMFCTVPFIFEYHAVPRDFYRWTYEGLHQDLENCGFDVLEIKGIESDWESVLTILQLFISRQFGYFFTKPLFFLLNLLSFLPTNKKYNLLPLTNAASAVKRPKVL